MKNVFKKALVLVIACLCVFSLVSCGTAVKGDEAKALINDFFAAIVDEDYDKAEGFLHPDLSLDLEEFFLGVEESKNVDFQSGIVIEKYTGFSTSVNANPAIGGKYELSMRTKVGDAPVSFTIELVRNKNGYGIYALDLDA